MLSKIEFQLRIVELLFKIRVALKIIIELIPQVLERHRTLLDFIQFLDFHATVLEYLQHKVHHI